MTSLFNTKNLRNVSENNLFKKKKLHETLQFSVRYMNTQKNRHRKI